MRIFFAAVLILFTVVAVISGLMIFLAFSIGPMPGQAPGANANAILRFIAVTLASAAIALYARWQIVRINKMAKEQVSAAPTFAGSRANNPAASEARMNAFDKICAVLAVALGVALILLGAAGL